MATAYQTKIAAALKNPNVQAVLNLIAEAEGTAKNGYFTEFGGGKLASLTKHPNVSHKFKQTDGNTRTTDAAGRYQFLNSTWDEEANKLGLTDFSPASQDLAAVSRLEFRGALDDVISGNFNPALKKLGVEWASLPSSPYKQPKKSQAFVDKTLARLMGKPLPSGAAPVAPAPTQVAALPVPAPTIAGLPVPVPAASPAVPWQDQVIAVQQEDNSNAWWQQEAMMQAADADMDMARQTALASFFEEPVVPQIQLPTEIDASINRYLAKL